MRIPLPVGLMLAFVIFLTGCSDDTSSSVSGTGDKGDKRQLHPETSIPSPDETGVLKVVTRNGSTTYYLNRNEEPVGPEFALIKAFAKAKGWKVEWEVLDSTSAVLDRLADGNTHIAAAGLTFLPSRDDRLTRGPSHTEITEQLVCHRDLRPFAERPEELRDLNIRVTAGSSYAETLTALAEVNDKLRFSEDTDMSTERLLGEVADGKLDCTVADSNIVQVNRRYMPHLAIAMDLNEPQPMGWYLPKGRDDLAKTATDWMKSEKGLVAISAVDYRYYTYIGEFDFVDVRALNRRIDARLPKFKEHFLTAEEQTGMPADLLAAQAYQESHWDPHAKSPTGVRGMMMLTLNTAKSLGVENRLDPVQSIDGGSRYLADRHRRLPDTIPEPDRTFLALASYNIGRGHLLDARTLARKLGKNPDSWIDMREVLPLLSDKQYYSTLRYGYARGYEPVQYVSRIRNYRDVIVGAFHE